MPIQSYQKQKVRLCLEVFYGQLRSSNPQPPKITDKQLLSDIEKSDLDTLFEEASEWAKLKKQVSIDYIRTKFVVGNNRAGIILEQLKVTGIVK